MGLFVGWPVVAAVRMSFYRWRGFGPMDDFVGLSNYQRVLTDDVFTDAVTHNSIIVVAQHPGPAAAGPGRRAAAQPAACAGGAWCARSSSCPYVVAEVIAGVIWFQLLQPGHGGRRRPHPRSRRHPARAGLPRHPEPGAVDGLRRPHLEVPRPGDPALPGRAAGRSPTDLYEAAQLDGAIVVADPAPDRRPAARPDDPHVVLPVDDRLAAALRHGLGPDRRRPGQRHHHDGDVPASPRAPSAATTASPARRRWSSSSSAS